MSEELPPWGQVQKRTFTRWCNVHLLDRKLKIEDLEKDLDDGLKLINLLEVISSKKIQYNKNVKFYSQKLENVGKALKFLKDEGLKLVAIGPEDIVEKRIKLILGLIWTIILRYQIQKVKYVDEGPGHGAAGAGAGAGAAKKEDVSSNTELLQWVNSAIPEHKVKNFKSDWKDGKALYALTNYLKPGILDASVADKLDPLERAAKASEAAEKQLKIPKILDPADLVSDAADDLSTMTYISMFRDYDYQAKKVDPSQTVAFGPGLEKASVGDKNHFTIQAKNAFGDPVRSGGAPFKVTVSGPAGGSGAPFEATVHDNNDGTYTVAYTPSLPGDHTVSVRFLDTPISKSPFHVLAEKVVKVSPAHTTVEGPQVGPDGRAHYVVVTRDDSGHPVDVGGIPIQVNIAGPDGTEAAAKVLQDPGTPGAYNVSILPPKTGDYKVSIGVKGKDPDVYEPVNGSPFVVKLTAPAEKPKPIDPNKVSVDLSGLSAKPNPDGTVAFTIKSNDPNVDISDAKFDVGVKSPSGQKIDAKVLPNPDGTFQAHFKPTESGPYHLEVSFTDPNTGATSQVPGSPFTTNVEVIPDKVDPAVEKAANDAVVDLSSLGAPPDADGKVHFNVVSKDLPEGTALESKITFAGEAVPTEVHPTPDGYGVYFKPKGDGDYIIDSNLVDKYGHPAKLKNSPLKVKLGSSPSAAEKPEEAVLQAAAASTVDLGSLNNGPDKDGNLTFHVNPKDIPEGAKLIPKITFLPDNTELPAAIKAKGDGTLAVAFQPVRSGDYLLEVFLADKNGKQARLKGTPIKLKLTVPERPAAEAEVQKAAEESFVDFSGLAAEPTEDGGVSFTVGVKGKDLPEGSQYDAKISYVPENALVPSRIEDNGDGTFRVLFYPKHEEGPAEYLVALNLLDKHGNPAKIRGGPYRVIVNIVRGPEMLDVEPAVYKAANNAALDMSPLNAGPNTEGKLHFNVINVNTIPEGSHLETKITFTADGSDIPTDLKSNDDDTKSVYFKPAGSGVYMIEVVLVDKKDMGASLKGTPIRLTLNMGTPAVPPADAPSPAVAQAAAASSVDLSAIGSGPNNDGNLQFAVNAPDIPEGAHLESKIIYVPENLDLPSDVKPVGDGKYSVFFKPAKTGEYLLAVNLVDKDGKSARLKGTPIKLMLTLPEAAYGAAGGPSGGHAEDGETDAARSVITTHSFTIEAYTKAGTPRIKGGDKVEISATGPGGAAVNVNAQVKDLGNGKYFVALSLPGHGKFAISATINGHPIVGSPFELNA